MKKPVDLKLATRLINHGPVVMVSSVSGQRNDITPVAWHMPVQKDPPVIVLEISESHFIYECILETGDFVVNIPPASLAEDIVKCGKVSGRDRDKFEMCGLAAVPSKEVRSPSLREALAVMECVLIRDEHLLKEYNMVAGSVKYAEAEDSAFSDHWLLSGDKVKTLHHLGDRTFCVPASGIIDLR